MLHGERLAALLSLSGLLVLWVGWIKAARPRVRRFGRRVSAALDTLGGRGAIEDYATGERLPEIQPLHVRLAGIERAQADQAKALESLAKVLAEQGELRRIAADHEVRLVSLEDVEAERSLAREESAAMWRAVGSRDVVDVESEENT